MSVFFSHNYKTSSVLFLFKPTFWTDNTARYPPREDDAQRIILLKLIQYDSVYKALIWSLRDTQRPTVGEISPR